MNKFTVLLLLPFTLAAAELLPRTRVVLMPFREAELVARIDCTVQKHLFRMGERFKSGDLLMQMDDTRHRIELARAKAKAADAKVQAQFAKQSYDAQKELFEQDFQSKMELEKRRIELETALARQQIADADFADARLLLGYCTVKAPFAGKIEKIYCREFESVRAGQPLVRIIDDSQLLAVMNIPLSERLPVGSVMRVNLDDGKISAQGKVLEISPQADFRSGTIEVKVLIPNSRGALTAGMTGDWQSEREAKK